MAITGVVIGVILGLLLFLLLVIMIVYAHTRRARQVAEKTKKEIDTEKLVEGQHGRKLPEYNYFGSTHSGPSSLAESSASIANSAPSLLPDTSSNNWTKPSRMPIKPTQIKRKPAPSPLRLGMPWTESTKIEHRSLSSIKSGKSIGGIYMPPPPSTYSPSTASNQSFPAVFEQQKPAGWVSPLDVHFSRPATPKESSSPRPTSYLPRLPFPEETEGSLHFDHILVAPGSEAKSEVASIVDSEISVPTEREFRSPPKVSNHSIFPPSRAGRQSSRSIWPMNEDSYRSTSRHHKVEQFEFGLSSVPLKNLPPIVVVDQFLDKSLPVSLAQKPLPSSRIPTSSTLPRHNSIAAAPSRLGSLTNSITPDVKPRATIRQSIVSQHRVSVHPPSRPRDRSSDVLNGYISPGSTQSVASSSIYSSRSSILENIRSQAFTPEPDLSDSPEPMPLPPRSQFRTRHHSNTSPGRRSSAQTLRRTRDSVKTPRRKSTQRNRSRSVKGKAIYFDQAGESPLSNANALPSSADNFSAHFEVSAAVDDEHSFDVSRTKQSIPPVHPAALNMKPSKDRLCVRHVESGSDVSQASIGDFYDAYYRQSGAMSSLRNSMLSVGGGSSGGGLAGLASENGNEVARKDVARRPAPIRPERNALSIAGENLAEEWPSPPSEVLSPASLSAVRAASLSPFPSSPKKRSDRLPEIV